MEKTSLKLLFIIAMTFPAANPLILEDYENCSLPFGRISTDEVAPIRHDVALEIMPQRNILSGITDITIDVKKPTTNISLHAHNLEIDMTCTFIMKPDATPRCHEKSAKYKLWEVVYCSENGIINLIFLDFISPGKYILHIEHISLLDKNVNKIIYPYSWANENRWMLTNIYSSNAIRRLFPSWDDMTIKEYLHITIKYDISYKIIINVPIWYGYEEKLVRRTFFTDIYQTSTHPITFMFVRDLMNITHQYDINYLWQENSKATADVEHVHRFAYHVILILNRMINITLSEIINKIDHVILPYGPMKSAGRFGLITYREKDVTYREGIDSPGKIIDIAKLVSYEMSRQLFVGIMNSHLNIEDKWFDEIFASFYSFYIAQQIWMKEEMMDLFVVQNLQAALDSDIYLETKPNIHKSKSDNGIDGLLYPLLYHKKAFVLIRMLLFGPYKQKFDEITKKYVQSRNTSFWTIIEKVYPERYIPEYTVKEIMDSWLTEIHHPEITFTRNYNIKTVTYNATFSNNAFNFIIPITYVMKPDMQLYINFFWSKRNETTSITDIESNHFLLVNMKLFGYYRVNYDSQNWQLLAEYLQSANYTYQSPIPVLNRAQIVNDAFYFTTIRKMGLHVFFNVIKFLNKETSYIVWHPMFNIFSYMSTFLKFSVAEATKANFVDILNELLRNVGYEEDEGENEMTMPLRLLAIKWACELGHEKCRKVAAEKLFAYIHNNKQNIFARWTTWMFCTGMMDANRTLSNLIWQHGFEEGNMEILEHLTCIEDKNILLHYLDLMSIIKSYEKNVTKLSIRKLCRSIIKKHIGKRKVLDFFLNNYFQIIDRFPYNFYIHDNLTLLGDIIMNVHSDLILNKINIYVTKELFGNELFNKVKKLIRAKQELLLRQRRKFKAFYDDF